LCSLANVQSDTAVEQLLGRVMRMLYAKSRKNLALNRAYAYVLSGLVRQRIVLLKNLKTRDFLTKKLKVLLKGYLQIFFSSNLQSNKIIKEKIYEKQFNLYGYSSQSIFF